jgi:hypothetical protein
MSVSRRRRGEGRDDASASPDLKPSCRS